VVGGLVCLSLVACNRGPTSAVGDPAAAERAAVGQGRPKQAPRSPAGGPSAAPAPSLLTSLDLAQGYQFIRERFFESVDHAGLIEAARGALRQSVDEAGGLPLDTAALDYLPGLTGNPERDVGAFGLAFDAVVQRHQAWSMEARPDYQALRAMVASLNDAQSVFTPAEQVRRRAEASGSGIGVRIARPDPAGPPVVVEVFPGGPAALAGVRGGDRILSVGERQVQQLELGDVADLIRGPQGSEVSLLLERTAAGGPVVVKTSRRTIDAPQADGQLLEQRVGYIRIREFGETAAERVGRLLLEQRQAGAEGWILDLRGNPGASLTAAARVAGYFLEPRPIALAVDRGGQREAIYAEARPFSVRAPLVLLIDGDSAQAAEIFASAFRDYNLAGLVGQRSAGRVGIADFKPLSDGSTLQVTVRRLVSVGGARLDKVGVEPDRRATLTSQDLEAGRDPQRDEALRALRERLAGR
jgi:carboxyl-terminal processing protease